MRLVYICAVGLAAVIGSATSVSAPSGPAATACKDNISKFCAGKEHGQGEVRMCLEANKGKVSPACREALETTAGGR
jgi:cysteine rich repeat protein